MCHDNRNRREIFNIVISPTRYYRKYRGYQKIHCSETFISVKYFQLIFTILVPVALLSDILIITLMIYLDMKFFLSPIPNRVTHMYVTYLQFGYIFKPGMCWSQAGTHLVSYDSFCLMSMHLCPPPGLLITNDVI